MAICQVLYLFKLALDDYYYSMNDKRSVKVENLSWWLKSISDGFEISTFICWLKWIPAFDTLDGISDRSDTFVFVIWISLCDVALALETGFKLIEKLTKGYIFIRLKQCIRRRY